MDTDNALNDFGKEFIQAVRDQSFWKYQMMRDGKMRSERAKQIFDILSSFNDEQLKKN